MAAFMHQERPLSSSSYRISLRRGKMSLFPPFYQVLSARKDKCLEENTFFQERWGNCWKVKKKNHYQMRLLAEWPYISSTLNLFFLFETFGPWVEQHLMPCLPSRDHSSIYGLVKESRGRTELFKD